MPSTFSGLKVFSATKAKEREELGARVTQWLRSHPEIEVVNKTVTQSSDREFHCLTITLFYREPASRLAGPAGPASGPAS